MIALESSNIAIVWPCHRFIDIVWMHRTVVLYDIHSLTRSHGHWYIYFDRMWQRLLLHTSQAMPWLSAHGHLTLPNLGKGTHVRRGARFFSIHLISNYWRNEIWLGLSSNMFSLPLRLLYKNRRGKVGRFYHGRTGMWRNCTTHTQARRLNTPRLSHRATGKGMCGRSQWPFTSSNTRSSIDDGDLRKRAKDVQGAKNLEYETKIKRAQESTASAPM